MGSSLSRGEGGNRGETTEIFLGYNGASGGFVLFFPRSAQNTGVTAGPTALGPQ